MLCCVTIRCWCRTSAGWHFCGCGMSSRVALRPYRWVTTAPTAHWSPRMRCVRHGRLCRPARHSGWIARRYCSSMSRAIAFFLISYLLFFHLFLLSEPGPYFDYQHPSCPAQRIGIEHNLRRASRRFMQTVENGGSLFASYTVFSGTAKTDE